MTFTNWTLAIGTEDDQKYMRPLFEFLLLQFVEIFGETILGAEQCIAYNDSTAPCPMLITNRTPIQLRTCSKSLRYWAQYIYQTSHELTHYVIRQYKEDKDAIVRWFEETLCEAMSLYILKSSSLRWHECALSHINSNYGTSLMDYFKSTYDETGPSSLKACRSLDDLKNVESTCQTQRISRTIERNYLVSKEIIWLMHFVSILKVFLPLSIIRCICAGIFRLILKNGKRAIRRLWSLSWNLYNLILHHNWVPPIRGTQLFYRFRFSCFVNYHPRFRIPRPRTHSRPGRR